MRKHVGSTLTSFLEDEGIKDDVDLLTIKKVLADEFEARMQAQGIKPTELAARMQTSRNQIYRLLDETDTGVTLATLSRAAKALDLNLLVHLEQRKAKKSGDKRRR